MLDIFKALILAIVEGITEFLPISSTAHLVFAAEILNFSAIPDYSFEIIIQFAAILPLFIIYRKDLFNPLFALSQKENRDFYLKFLIAFMPILVIGGYFGAIIKSFIFNLNFIVCSLIFGGVLMIFIDKLLPQVTITNIKDVCFKKAFIIGCFQILALIPGMSRSGSTIIGAMLIGVQREAAAKFSFFLAIPTIFAATIYDLYNNYHNLIIDGYNILIIGFIVTFFVAYFVILNFSKIISNIGFRILGTYRILIGTIMLCCIYWGF